MRARVGVVAGMTFLAWLAAPAPAAEKVIWKIGEPDQSDHEFASTNLLSGKPVVVRVEGGGEAKQWPKFHPGSGNGAFGGRPHKFSLVFQLPAPVPHGTFSLDLSLLFRQPRVPAVELEVNGHAGRYYFDPEPMFELGSGDDQFNPLRSIQRRKIALAARWFRAGENVLAISCIDDPPVVTNNRTVGGGGDSGCFYDALALSQDPDAAPREKFEVSLIPTVFFPRSAKGFEEQCWLDVRFPSSWQGGRARVALGDFTVPVEMAKPAEFGEARYSTLVPGDLPAQVARIDVSSTWQPGGNTAAQPQTFSVPFAPARKWKLFYAPSVHLDIGYTDYRPKVAEVHSRNLDALLTVFQAHPTYRFNLDGSWVVEQWLATRSAEQASQLAEHARAGRIGMNALYASFVTDYPSLEEFFRSLYLSHELRAKGIPLECAFITDIPSNSWAVPSVLASAGIRYFADAGNQDRGPLIVHGHWNARSPFWWEGPDGQRVLAWFSSHYHQVKAFFGLPPAIESGKGGVARFLRTYERADYAPDAVLIFGTEVENVPLDYADAAFVERWNAQFAYPQIITCRFAEFFQYLEKNFADRLPVVRGEGGAYWGENFSTFAVPTARDRANQVRATSAETLASVTAAPIPRLRFPRPLNRDIWTNLLLYAEHTFGSVRHARSAHPRRGDRSTQGEGRSDAARGRRYRQVDASGHEPTRGSGGGAGQEPDRLQPAQLAAGGPGPLSGGCRNDAHRRDHESGSGLRSVRRGRRCPDHSLLGCRRAAAWLQGLPFGTRSGPVRGVFRPASVERRGKPVLQGHTGAPPRRHQEHLRQGARTRARRLIQSLPVQRISLYQRRRERSRPGQGGRSHAAPPQLALVAARRIDVPSPGTGSCWPASIRRLGG